MKNIEKNDGDRLKKNKSSIIKIIIGIIAIPFIVVALYYGIMYIGLCLYISNDVPEGKKSSKEIKEYFLENYDVELHKKFASNSYYVILENKEKRIVEVEQTLNADGEWRIKHNLYAKELEKIKEEISVIRPNVKFSDYDFYYDLDNENKRCIYTGTSKYKYRMIDEVVSQLEEIQEYVTSHKEYYKIYDYIDLYYRAENKTVNFRVYNDACYYLKKNYDEPEKSIKIKIDLKKEKDTLIEILKFKCFLSNEETNGRTDVASGIELEEIKDMETNEELYRKKYGD